MVMRDGKRREQQHPPSMIVYNIIFVPENRRPLVGQVYKD